jgi:hypothetical protein
MAKGTEKCDFKVTVKDVPKAVKAVRDFITKKAGGTMSGDDTAGSFKFNKAYSDISGSYSVKDKDVLIKAQVKDGWVSCEDFSDALQKEAAKQ